MTSDNHTSADASLQAGGTVRIVQHQDDPSHRIAFGTLHAAEGFIAHSGGAAAWIIEPLS